MINARCNDCKHMPRLTYPEAAKQEALRLLAEAGPAEASRRTGIPIGTIASWGHRGGVKAPSVASSERMVAGAQVEWARRRVVLGERMGTAAEMALQRIEQKLESGVGMGSMRDIAATAAVLIDRAQLLTGGATSRSEVVERTPEAEVELAKVLQLVRSMSAA